MLQAGLLRGQDLTLEAITSIPSLIGTACPFHKLELYEIGELPVLALFAVGDVYASLCKKWAYASFSA